MTETLYPIGYGTRLVTMAELRAVHEPHMHPEYARRLWPWLESCGGLIGIGGGFRKLGEQPNKPGFAKEGQSFHQPQPYVLHPGTYAAVDLVVVNPGSRHRAPRWSEVPQPRSAEAVRRGLHCNVYPSETWHMQAIEISGWRTWTLTGRKDPVAGYPIPGGDKPKLYAPKPTQKLRAIGQIGNDKAEVVALQNACNFWGWADAAGRPLTADGRFGPYTAQAVANMQRALKTLAADGEYGPRTAAAFQRFLESLAPA